MMAEENEVSLVVQSHHPPAPKLRVLGKQRSQQPGNHPMRTHTPFGIIGTAHSDLCPPHASPPPHAVTQPRRKVVQNQLRHVSRGPSVALHRWQGEANGYEGTETHSLMVGLLLTLMDWLMTRFESLKWAVGPSGRLMRSIPSARGPQEGSQKGDSAPLAALRCSLGRLVFSLTTRTPVNSRLVAYLTICTHRGA